uniref:alpha-mannosidase n=1 Tax=Amphimedon queenslandica TaxID=400682 RepID=A0A1X7VI80_AMPQE
MCYARLVQGMAVIFVLTLSFLCCFFQEASAYPIEENKALPLNVHLVAHSHDDVGWLKNVDEYYYGAKNDIQHAAVQYIISTVVEELSKNKDRKFIYVEIAFFVRWWNEQTDDVKQQVHELVKSGQLEFINGGWSMNDEATVHYNGMIDQMSFGLRFLSNTFGIRPVVGWQIDPFGHTAFQATAFSLIGFDSMFFARNDYADKARRLNTSEMEMIWKSSQSLGDIADIFTGVLYHHYSPPPGFCYDSFCSDPPIQDDENLFDDNVKERVNDFIALALEQAKHFKTNNIMMTMGSDFQYENAQEWFKNLDKLIKYVNMNGSVNVMYSTPSIYVSYINKETQLTWTTKTDDFVPYADAPHNYWSGFFTSRPALKGYVRQCNAHLQACKQLEAIHNGMGDNGPSSVKLQKAMGLALHHDAITGTEKQVVADDYAKRLHIGEVECRSVMATVLNDLAAKGANAPKMNLSFCEYLNISVCPVTEGGDFNMVVYNSLARPYTGVVRLPIIKDTLSVTDPDGNAVTVQIVPIDNSTRLLAISSNDTAELVAVFEVDVPPMGYAIYTAKTTGTLDYTQRSSVNVQKSNDDTVISNKYYKVEFDAESGHLKMITNLVSSISMDYLLHSLDNVHLLTLEYLDKSTILLRLDHQFESDDPKEWSAPASVKLS